MPVPLRRQTGPEQPQALARAWKSAGTGSGISATDTDGSLCHSDGTRGRCWPGDGTRCRNRRRAGATAMDQELGQAWARACHLGVGK